MKLFKVLVDGKEIEVPDGNLEIVHEFNEVDDDVPPGAQIHFRFTREGQIVEYIDNDQVIDLTNGTWDQFLEDAGV